jgi:hypothetical protein
MLNREAAMETRKNVGFSRGGVHKNPKYDKRALRRDSRKQEKDY